MQNPNPDFFNTALGKTYGAICARMSYPSPESSMILSNAQIEGPGGAAFAEQARETEINTLKSDRNELESELQEAKGENEALRSDIQKLRSKLRRSRSLRQKREEARAKIKELNEYDETLLDYEQQLERMGETHKRQQRVINTQAQRLQEKDATIVTQAQLLQEKDATIVTQTQLLQQLQGEVRSRDPVDMILKEWVTNKAKSEIVKNALTTIRDTASTESIARQFAKGGCLVSFISCLVAMFTPAVIVAVPLLAGGVLGGGGLLAVLFKHIPNNEEMMQKCMRANGLTGLSSTLSCHEDLKGVFCYSAVYVLPIFSDALQKVHSNSSPEERESKAITLSNAVKAYILGVSVPTICAADDSTHNLIKTKIRAASGYMMSGIRDYDAQPDQNMDRAAWNERRNMAPKDKITYPNISSLVETIGARYSSNNNNNPFHDTLIYLISSAAMCMFHDDITAEKPVVLQHTEYLNRVAAAWIHLSSASDMKQIG